MCTDGEYIYFVSRYRKNNNFTKICLEQYEINMDTHTIDFVKETPLLNQEGDESFLKQEDRFMEEHNCGYTACNQTILALYKDSY